MERNYFMRKELELSALGHTWVIDLDGTIVKHNGYKIDGEDRFLHGAEEFLRKIPLKDMVIFITSREERYRDITESFLNKHHIKYNYIIFGAPYGERILMNDDKPSGLSMSVAVRMQRDHFTELDIKENCEW